MGYIEAWVWGSGLVMGYTEAWIWGSGLAMGYIEAWAWGSGLVMGYTEAWIWGRGLHWVILGPAGVKGTILYVTTNHHHPVWRSQLYSVAGLAHVPPLVSVLHSVSTGAPLWAPERCCHPVW